MPGDLLVRLEPVDEHVDAADAGARSARRRPRAGRCVRADLAEVLERHRVGLDEARPDAVASGGPGSRRTARENVDDLVDDGSFVEYGPVVIAAQRRRRSSTTSSPTRRPTAWSAASAPSTATCSGREASRAIAVSYDYTVLAGTQGLQNHRKKDRLFELAERLRLPIVFFTEGGGGRPGDTDGIGRVRARDMAFLFFAELSGLVPLVGVNAGYCFAGNAAILGCCDVVIATEDSNIGMGGPAMIEGGGLGVFEPTAIGPIEVQRANGVVDIVVADEAEAVAVAKQYLSYFQGRVADWECADQALLRDVDPGGPPAQLRRPQGHRPAVRHRVGARAAARLRASGWSPRWPASRAGRSGSSPTTRPTSPGPSTRRAPTRRPASCSCATPSTCRSSRCATRRG